MNAPDNSLASAITSGQDRMKIEKASRLSSVPEAPPLSSMQRETARYIGQMSAELSAMARKSDFDLLAYFLEMARVEARALLRKLEQGAVRRR